MGEAISIHALREEGDRVSVQDFKDGAISIHALREEGDRPFAASPPPAQNFYPRPPRGGRPHTRRGDRWAWEFLSTPSARRATIFGIKAELAVVISIHALREEGDELIVGRVTDDVHPFLSTPSARRATCALSFAATTRIFLSTPSARRATRTSGRGMESTSYFYPRPPRGGRRYNSVAADSKFEFLSTPSARRATATQMDMLGNVEISIHALREEGDQLGV